MPPRASPLPRRLPNCVPVLLEPIHELTVAVPGEATAKVNAILSARRAQILGFEPRPGWGGWDMVRALVPEAEIGDLIVELRSASAGAGYFTSRFDHMAELAGGRPRPWSRQRRRRDDKVNVAGPALRGRPASLWQRTAS